MSEDDTFFARFWGVRGSIACPGPATVRYGGNTSCVEVRCGRRRLLFDAGTGLRAFDRALGAAPLDADLFFTHTHLDHICGWPFFSALTRASTRLRVWAGHLRPDHEIAGVLDGLLDEPFAPVGRASLAAAVTYTDFEAGDAFAPHPGIAVRTVALNHPQGATGYRVDYGGRAICYLTDTEHRPGSLDTDIVDLIAGADVVIYDATYTEEEFAAHVGWGHSTWNEGVRLCEAAGARTFVAFHHEPEHDDDTMDAIAAALVAARPGSVVAREGMVLAP